MGARRWWLGRSLGVLGLTVSGALPVAAQPALGFELPRLDGSAFVRLDDYRGRPVLLNFWSSDCPPCVAEMPLLFEQARRHPGLSFLGIAIDQRAAATRFLAQRAPTYPQLIALQAPDVLLRRFGNRRGALPFTVVLDAQHRPCRSRAGEVEATWIDAAVRACGAA